LRIQLEYEQATRTMTAMIYDKDNDSFERCFKMNLKKELDFNGYFVIAGSSGDYIPFEHRLESFKLFYPKVF
jgi:hypothetical protein